MFQSLEIKGTFRPLQDWVVLAPIKKATEKGGILLPESAHEYGACEVISVGPGYHTYDGKNNVYGCHLIPTSLKPGQMVWIEKFVDGEWKGKLNGREVYIVRERHLNLTIAA